MSWGLQKCQGQQKGAFKIVFRESKPPNRDGQFYVNRWQSTKQIAQLFYLSKRMIIRLKKTEQILIWENWKKQRWGNFKTRLAFQMDLGLMASEWNPMTGRSTRWRVRTALDIQKYQSGKMGVRQETAQVKRDPNFQKMVTATAWVS